jgi:hypothetical protein
LSGIRGFIFAALISAMTEYSENVEHPMKWLITVPSFFAVNLDVPSGITPAPCVDRIVGHRFVFGDAQKMHAGALHCGV